MWTPTVVVLSLLVWKMGFSLDINDCPSDLERDKYLSLIDGKCYYFYHNLRREYENAMEICQSKGGILASLKTRKINDLVWKKLKVDYKHDDDKVWIGLSDQVKENTYLWQDGTKTDYENFEPNTGVNTRKWDFSNIVQDCVSIKIQDGKWEDEACSDNALFVHRHAFLCEYTPDPNNTHTTRLPATFDNCPDTIPHDEYLKVLHNTCYYFYINVQHEFESAQDICKKRGGNLVSIKSHKMNDYIQRELKSSYKFKGEIWIGLSDLKEETKFVWMDGSPMAYHNFATGEGLGVLQAFEDCVALDSETGEWHDHICSGGFTNNHRQFICEFKASPRKSAS